MKAKDMQSAEQYSTDFITDASGYWQPVSNVMHDNRPYRRRSLGRLPVILLPINLKTSTKSFIVKVMFEMVSKSFLILYIILFHPSCDFTRFQTHVSSSGVKYFCSNEVSKNIKYHMLKDRIVYSFSWICRKRYRWKTFYRSAHSIEPMGHWQSVANLQIALPWVRFKVQLVT